MGTNTVSVSQKTPPLRIRLGLIRAAWFALTGLILGLTIVGLQGRYAQLYGDADTLSLLDLGFSAESYAAYLSLLDLIVISAHVVIAAVIVFRRPGDWMAQYVGIALVAGGAILPLSTMYSGVELGSVIQLLVNMVIYIGLATGLTTLFLFPDGRFVPRWTRVLAGAWAVTALGVVFLGASALASLPLAVQVLIPLAFAATGVYAQIYRYTEISSPLQRQQTKWAVFGLTLAVLGPVVFVLPIVVPSLSQSDAPSILYRRVGFEFFTISLILRLVASTFLAFMLTLFPISFAIACLRYRLWDIDVFINRALVYSALTGTLVAVYLAGVALLQALLGALTGQGDQLAIVATTLAIAGLFNPLRVRLQTAIDRRFYRRRYNAAQALADFSSTAQEQVDLESLSEALLGVVDESIQPAHLSIWLR